jgi:peptidoglycan/LPS O-acetylase OafA/YrhL
MTNDTNDIGLAHEPITSKATDERRDASIDVARGAAIISIVLYHVLRGLDSAHLLGHGTWIATTDRVLAFWQISVFAFLGGIFVAKSVRKYSMQMYVRERTFRFMVIYVVWTGLEGSVMLLAARVVNKPVSIGSLLRLWIPMAQLWYMPFVAAITLLVVPLRPWEPRRAPWLLGLSAVLSIALWGLNGPVIGTQGLGLVVFFVGGMILGVDRLQSFLRSIPSAVAGVAGVGLFALGVVIVVCALPTPPTQWGSGRTVFSVALGVPVCVGMSAAALLMARAARSWNFLAVCGRRSIDIYLAHITLAAGSRIVLVKLGLHSPVLLAASCVFAGVFGSLLVATVLRRIGLAWIFDGPALPAWLEKRSRRSTPA